jgi:uncharacterized membrane protein YcjF (UPF0283 family)
MAKKGDGSMAEGPPGSGQEIEVTEGFKDERRQPWTKVLVAVVAILIVAALGFGGYQLFIHPLWAQVLRDIFIILMAVQSLAIGILLIILIFQIINLTRLLREEVLPILNSTNETVSTVKQTTSFVSEAVVSPLVKALSTASAIQGGLRAILRRPRSRNGTQG